MKEGQLSAEYRDKGNTSDGINESNISANE